MIVAINFEKWAVNFKLNLNIFQSSVAFHKNQSFDLLPQIKCAVSIWNATLGWNELSNLLLDNKGSIQFFLGGALKFFQKQIHECLLETLKLLCTDKNQYKNH